MTAEVAEALEASIAKWKRNSRVRNPDRFLIQAEDCPLCALFYMNDCTGCPVAMKTGRAVCEGTPYYDAVKAWDVYWYDDNGKAARAAAREEVAFLESLREPPQ
jgi:hypothetical protein